MDYIEDYPHFLDVILEFERRIIAGETDLEILDDAALSANAIVTAVNNANKTFKTDIANKKTDTYKNETGENVEIELIAEDKKVAKQKTQAIEETGRRVTIKKGETTFLTLPPETYDYM